MTKKFEVYCVKKDFRSSPEPASHENWRARFRYRTDAEQYVALREWSDFVILEVYDD